MTLNFRTCMRAAAALLSLGGILFSIPVISLEAGNPSLRQAVQQKQIVPLESIMEWIEERYLGQIVEVELENEGGFFSYEVDLLTPSNSKLEFRFDARTGELLSVSGRDAEKARRK